uniref:MADF domain-containing protein n=1 Tax=Trichogramma kaykai TaxID=54128 RepID=A0ABD2XE80_9HYME
MDRQDKLSQMIRNSFPNFKKLGKDMMTAGACISRMDQLKKRWQEFESNHNKLSKDESCALRRIRSSNAPNSGDRVSVRGGRLSDESGYATTVSVHI